MVGDAIGLPLENRSWTSELDDFWDRLNYGRFFFGKGMVSQHSVLVGQAFLVSGADPEAFKDHCGGGCPPEQAERLPNNPHVVWKRLPGRRLFGRQRPT